MQKSLARLKVIAEWTVPEIAKSLGAKIGWHNVQVGDGR
jgi:hypothetical protein